MTEPRDNSAKGVFGRLQVRLDPWQPEFGPEFAGFDEMAADGPESVDIELERPRDHWEPIDPDHQLAAETPRLVHRRVRRLEARVTAKLDGQYSYGAFGAYGVGAVQIDQDQACFERSLTGRVFALCSAEQPGGEISIAPGLEYIPSPRRQTRSQKPRCARFTGRCAKRKKR